MAPEATKILSEQWMAMDDSQKEKYRKLYANDKQRYDTQMKEFNETGKFTLEDGSSSSTLKAKKKYNKRLICSPVSNELEQEVDNQ